MVAHEGGHAVVSAVAGSGKSATLVERICALLDRGERAGNILVLMFNRSAADEFRQRLVARIPEGPRPEVFTFHGFGLRMCEWLEDAGLMPPARTESDPVRLDRLAHEALEGLLAPALAVRSEPQGVTDDFLSGVDMLKGALYTGGPLPAGFPGNPKLMSRYDRFEQLRKAAGVRTLSDLIYEPTLCAFQCSDAAAMLANRYTHILVDEFQDINEAQMQLVRLVAGARASIMAVGDDDQTIYVWRGARPDYMAERFEDFFSPVRRYRLSLTFRYGHTLSLMANACIGHNSSREDKLSVSMPGRDTQLAVRMYRNDAADLLVEEVRKWQSAGRRLGEVAVLVREYAHCMPLQMILRKAMLPYRLVGAPPIMTHPSVMLLRAHLAIASGRFAKLDRDTCRTHLRVLLEGAPLFLNRDELDMVFGLVLGKRTNAARAIAFGLNKVAMTGKGSLVGARRLGAAHYAWLDQLTPTAPAAHFLEEVLKRCDIVSRIHQGGFGSARSEAQVSVLFQIVDLARTNNSCIFDFDASIEESAAQMSDTGTEDALLITSVHRAKGLEWPCVMIPDLAEGKFPAAGARLEDERRLFYVAATRARERLVLMAPLDGQLVEWTRAARYGHPQSPVASRFLYESQLEAATRIGESYARLGHPGVSLSDLDGELRAMVERYSASFLDCSTARASE